MNTQLSGALQGGTDVTLATGGTGSPGTDSGLITINASVNGINGGTGGNLTLTANSANPSGSVTFAAGVSLDKNLAVTGATVSQTAAGVLTVHGTTTVNAPGAVILSTAAANSFIGAVTIISSGAVAVASPQAVAFGTVTATDLTASATLGISQPSGTITSTGTATLSANTSHDVTLNASGNDFNEVKTGGTVADLTIRDANAVALDDISTNGLVVVTTNGAITQLSSTAILPTTATVLNAGSSGDITLQNAGNNFAGLEIDNAHNVSVVDTNTLTTSGITTTGTLALTASGSNQRQRRRQQHARDTGIRRRRRDGAQRELRGHHARQRQQRLQVVRLSHELGERDAA